MSPWEMSPYEMSPPQWDGLKSRDTVSNKSRQHGWSKGTHHEQSTRKINGQEKWWGCHDGKQENKRRRKTVPVWLLRALTYHLKGMPYRAFLPKRKINALEMGLSQQEVTKAAEYLSLINDSSDVKTFFSASDNTSSADFFASCW